MQPSLPSALPQHCTSSLERICNESNSRRIKGAQNAFSIPRRIPVLRPSRVVLRDLNLQVNKVAAYLQICGTTPLNACQSCLEGQGPFIQCVVANGFMNGACANCYYDHHESRCSLKGKLDLKSTIKLELIENGIFSKPPLEKRLLRRR